jgi:hypothetical protein
MDCFPNERLSSRLENSEEKVADEYDIFVKDKESSVLWLECIRGRENAVRRVMELGSRSRNEHFAVDAATGEILVCSNPTIVE